MTDERVRVKVRATDRGGGVSAIRVRTNGVRQGGERGVHLSQLSPTAFTYEQEVELTLMPGENVITAEADNVLGHIRARRPRAR